MKKIIYGVIFLITILLFIGLIFSVNNGIQLSKVNSMSEDIDILEDKIALYYLKFRSIPIKEKVDFYNSVNPNDDSTFYEIDISKLDNINLNYGKKNKGEKDYYIINNESHTIYYYAGVQYKNKMYYTKNVNYTKIKQK